jgi:hypothetical protein
MTTSTFNIKDMRLPIATRPNGQVLLEHVVQVLSSDSGSVVIDFCELNPTPSFVDQSIGGIVKSFGLELFKSRVKLVNVSDDLRPLIRHVILTRAAQTSKTLACSD